VIIFHLRVIFYLIYRSG